MTQLGRLTEAELDARLAEHFTPPRYLAGHQVVELRTHRPIVHIVDDPARDRRGPDTLPIVMQPMPVPPAPPAAPTAREAVNAGVWAWGLGSALALAAGVTLVLLS